MENNKSMLEKISEIIGELICFIPLFYITNKFNLLAECIIAMVSFFSYKIYLKQTIEHLKTKHCVMLTYTVFLAITIFYAGVQTLSIYTFNQPLIIIYSSLGVSALCAYIGQKQAKAKLQEEREKKDFTRFGFTPTTAQIAYDWKIEKLDTAELLEKYPQLSPLALERRKTRINKRFEQLKIKDVRQLVGAQK